MTWLLVSDVDDTLTGDDAELARLFTALETAREPVIVTYNSSRPCASVRATIAQTAVLPAPVYLVGALGTEIEDVTGERLAGYHEQLLDGWRRAEVDRLARAEGLTPHAAEFQTDLKASYDAPDEAPVARLRQRLADDGLPHKLIYSGGRNVDLIPARAGKAAAIHFLVDTLNLAPHKVVVAGDSGNDVDMFVRPYRGIAVGNADDDLRSLTGDHIYFAEADHAAGVLEGLRRWRVLEETE